MNEYLDDLDIDDIENADIMITDDEEEGQPQATPKVKHEHKSEHKSARIKKEPKNSEAKVSEKASGKRINQDKPSKTDPEPQGMIVLAADDQGQHIEFRLPRQSLEEQLKSIDDVGCGYHSRSRSRGASKTFTASSIKALKKKSGNLEENLPVITAIVSKDGTEKKEESSPRLQIAANLDALRPTDSPSMIQNQQKVKATPEKKVERDALSPRKIKRGKSNKIVDSILGKREWKQCQEQEESPEKEDISPLFQTPIPKKSDRNLGLKIKKSSDVKSAVGD